MTKSSIGILRDMMSRRWKKSMVFHTAIVIALVLLSILLGANRLTAQDQRQSSPTPVGKTPCTCPAFSITSNLEMVKKGETVEFHIVSDNTELLKKGFEWTVSAGEIISGQGTSQITVRVPETEPIATPSPPPLKSPTDANDPNGFFLFGGPRNPKTPLNVSVKSADAVSCNCPPAGLTIKIGTRSIAMNLAANVEDLKLDKTNVVLPCPPGQVPQSGKPGSDPIVNVTTTAKDPENDIIVYVYTVSGGKIIGTGLNVQWDLSGVPPGTYTITAGVDDGCGICGRTKTETVTVQACTPTCGLVSCPELSLIGPTETDDPGVYVVTAKVFGGSQDQPITYHWSITNGVIISGQGEPFVHVKTSLDSKAANAIVTLKIGGLDPEGICVDKASISIPKN